MYVEVHAQEDEEGRGGGTSINACITHAHTWNFYMKGFGFVSIA